MIPLNDNHPFINDETVISKEDFDKLKANIIKIKGIKKDLEVQIEDYKSIIHENDNNIKKLGLLRLIKRNLF